MTLLATLYPNYVSTEFYIEEAMTCPKRLVLNWEQAVEWTMAEITEGRSVELDEWQYVEHNDGVRRTATWTLECNEEGSTEEWILVAEEVPFWKPE